VRRSDPSELRKGLILRTRNAVLLSLLFAFAGAGPAAAAVPHTVGAGETLWSIAAANNMSTAYVASYNGLSPEAHVVLGRTVQIPAAGAAPATSAPPAAAPAPTTGSSTVTSGASQHSHTVVPGETLWSIAAANGMSTTSLASYNGLSPEAHVVLGRTVRIPAAGQAAPMAAARQAAPVAAAPQPTAQRSSSTQVGSIAAQHSTTPSLAAGVAYQESGFNNSAVSSAGARGVMQIMPGTWRFIQENLTPTVTLNPNSTQDNVRAGVLYLDYLRRTMGSEDAAIAAYYQGPNSVRARGLLPGTQHYVANVRANQSRFAGTP